MAPQSALKRRNRLKADHRVGGPGRERASAGGFAYTPEEESWWAGAVLPGAAIRDRDQQPRYEDRDGWASGGRGRAVIGNCAETLCGTS